MSSRQNTVSSCRLTKIPIQSLDNLDEQLEVKAALTRVREEALSDLVKNLLRIGLSISDVEHITDSHSLVPYTPNLGEARLYVSWSYTAIVKPSTRKAKKSS